MNSTSDEEKRIQSSIAYELERSKEQGVLSFRGFNLRNSKPPILFDCNLAHIRKLELCTSATDVGNCGLTSNAIQALVEAKMPQLEYIELTDNYLGMAGAKLLCTAHWPLLQELFLGTCQLNDQAVHQLVASYWPSLKVLWLANNPFGLASLCSLRRSDLHALKELWLRNCYLKPEGGKFSSSDALQLFRFSTSSLRTLRLSTTRLTVDCQPLLECTKATLKHRFPEATLQ